MPIIGKIVKAMLPQFQDGDKEIAKNASFFFLEYLILDSNETTERVNVMLPILQKFLVTCLSNLVYTKED